MVMIVPIISAAAPFLIQLAEHLFPKGPDGIKTGTQKRVFVIRICEIVYDKFIRGTKFGVIPKELFIEFCGILVDQMVPEVVHR